jgi:hypothetical protein
MSEMNRLLLSNLPGSEQAYLLAKLHNSPANPPGEGAGRKIIIVFFKKYGL